ncbi:MAG: hypothetical protein J6B89_03510 [Bacilli bacterium]|nr:hypothetical protein [Bacilli bacterium]
MKNENMGRPFISGQPKTVKITVMLDNDEHEDLKEKAQRANKTISQYIRDLVKKQK